MPELLDAPSATDTAAAKDIFGGNQSFNDPNYQAATPPAKVEPAVAPAVPKEEAATDASKPDAVTDKPKSRLEKMGQVKKPEPLKEEAKVEPEVKAEVKEPKDVPELRKAYNITKAEAQSLKAELEKIKPDYEQIRKDFDLTREELSKLKAMNLNDEERKELVNLKETHALDYLKKHDKEFQSTILNPIYTNIDLIEKRGAKAGLDGVGIEALKGAMDLTDELDRNQEIRRVLKTVEDLEPEKLQDIYNSLTAIGKELNDKLYPAMDKAEKSAIDREMASQHKRKEMEEQSKVKEQEEYQKEHEFVYKEMTGNILKALMEDTDLSVDGVTLAEALKDAKPATDPRERATEVQSLASMPFLLRKLNNALAEVYELKQGNKIRNGTAPKLSDGQPKTPNLNGHNPDANAVFKGHGSFGG